MKNTTLPSEADERFEFVQLPTCQCYDPEPIRQGDRACKHCGGVILKLPVQSPPPVPPVESGELEEFDKRQHEMLKGIDDYRKFKGSDDEIERTVAWIHQLSPWNLERGIQHLRDRFAQIKSQAEVEARIDELGNVQLEHGRYVTTTWVHGESMTIEERIAALQQPQGEEQDAKE